MKRIIFFLLLTALSSSAISQPRTTKGTEFWFTFMENLTLSFNGPPDFSIVISSETGTTGQIQVPHTGLSIPFTVPAMSDIEVTLPSGILYPQGDEATINFGFKIVANDSVNVYAYHHRVYFSEATMVLPANELTSEYMVAAQKDYFGGSPSEFVIEATADSTVVEIIPSQITASFRPSGVPFTVQLNKGNVFQLQSYENLTGSRVRSLDPTKKLAVFAGARQANVKCSGADDHLFEQNYMGSFGTEFVTVPFSGQGGDVFNIVSLEDSNSVFINFGSAINLGKGAFIDTLLTSASYIVSSKPIAIAQYNKSQACNNSQLGDPNMVMLAPVNLMKQNALFRNIDYDPNGPGAFSAYFVNIVVPSSGTGAVFLDGQQVTGFQTLASNGAYSWRQLAVSPGSHHLTAAGGMNALTYGLGSYNSYAYHLGFDYNNNPVGIYESEPQIHQALVTPNPFVSAFAIQIQSSIVLSKSTLKIYSADGRLVKEKMFDGNTVTAERESMEAGIYFFTITSEGQYITSGKIAAE